MIQWETGVDPLATSLAKLKEVIGSRLATEPEEDGWRLQYLGKLLEARVDAYYGGEDTHQLTGLIESLCSS